MPHKWEFLVRVYYGPDVKLPRKPGALAIEVGCDSPGAAALEVQAALSRNDISSVSVVRSR